MNEQQATGRPGKVWLAALVLVGLAAATAAAVFYALAGRDPERTVSPPPSVASVANIGKEARYFCGICHLFPEPDLFPRSAWKDLVEHGYFFSYQANMKLQRPPVEQVIRYYEERAPEELPRSVIERASTPLPVRLQRLDYPVPPPGRAVTLSNVNLVHLTDPRRLDVLATDMGSGRVLLLKPYEANPSWRVLGTVRNPAHVEVVDLDGDGIKDLLVADLGSFPPTDRLQGSVVWLRGRPDGTFTPLTLLKDVGRVADVQAADLNGDGKLDLIVAVFGWRDTGEVIVLENRTTDWEKPEFKPHVIDRRHGAIHVPVADLNRDGKPDFVALFAQEHESVVAFINEGDFRFRPKPLYTAPNPAYGSSGIQLVDLNGDGKLDVLYTNGDTLDTPHLLKPYHGVQWLENRTTDWEKPEFVHHPIGPLYGVHRAVAGDVNGDGKMHILAVSYLPPEHFPQRDGLNLDSVVFFEQVAPGKFVRHTLETKSCDHVTCAVGNLFGTGKLDLVTAEFRLREPANALTIWKNLGRATVSPP